MFIRDDLNPTETFPRPRFAKSEQAGTPLPSQLKLFREIIDDTIKGRFDGVTEKLKANGLEDEIVSVRGTSMIIKDLCFDLEPIDTLMWNPLHYAVYFQHFELVKYFI